MSHLNPRDAPAVSYPPTMTREGPGAPNVVTVPPPMDYPSEDLAADYPQQNANPPMGYPSEDGAADYPQQNANQQTTTWGDGFWKGCYAALCCCRVLECCFSCVINNMC